MLNIKLHKFTFFVLYSFSLLVISLKVSCFTIAARWDDAKTANKAEIFSSALQSMLSFDKLDRCVLFCYIHNSILSY